MSELVLKLEITTVGVWDGECTRVGIYASEGPMAGSSYNAPFKTEELVECGLNPYPPQGLIGRLVEVVTFTERPSEWSIRVGENLLKPIEEERDWHW